jgi:hypothetical protein
MKQAKQNKQSTFAALVADSELSTEVIQVGTCSVTIRELTGRERFALSDKADDPRWDTLCWCAFTGMTDPKPETIEEMDSLKPEFVVQIANAVLAISGMAADADDEAENESASVTDIGGS